MITKNFCAFIYDNSDKKEHSDVLVQRKVEYVRNYLNIVSPGGRDDVKDYSENPVP